MDRSHFHRIAVLGLMLGSCMGWGFEVHHVVHEAPLLLSQNQHHVTDFIQSVTNNPACLIEKGCFVKSPASIDDTLREVPRVMEYSLRNAVTLYCRRLEEDPLRTKMVTGAALAVLGDAMAQSVLGTERYDSKRAISFAAFDAVYRGAQHVLYPPLIQYCHGQFLLSLCSTMVATSSLDGIDPLYFAAMEQTLGSQLIIIPAIYYPVFFAVTGAVQGLSASETMERAKQTFFPIMKRNLMFWIPMQFLVFGFVPDQDLQIPILTALGLVWTIILSISAGAASTNNVPIEIDDEQIPEPEMAFDSTAPSFSVSRGAVRQ